MHKIPDKTVFLGKKIISLPACESTNSLMISMAQANWMDEGTIIISENQTEGKGQAGNKWVSEPGANLTFSILLKPTFLGPARQFYLNMAVSLGVADAVFQLTGVETKIKWPNDVLADAKKVCGILIENQVQGQQLSQSVVGIGLNVNQKVFEWPKASSLSLCAGMDFDKSRVFEMVLEKLDARYVQLKENNFQKLKSDYYSYLYWKDEAHEFSSDNKTFNGTIKGIDETGRLLVLVEGEELSFNFKEIKFLK